MNETKRVTILAMAVMLMLAAFCVIGAASDDSSATTATSASTSADDAVVTASDIDNGAITIDSGKDLVEVLTNESFAEVTVINVDTTTKDTYTIASVAYSSINLDSTSAGTEKSLTMTGKTLNMGTAMLVVDGIAVTGGTVNGVGNEEIAYDAFVLMKNDASLKDVALDMDLSETDNPIFAAVLFEGSNTGAAGTVTGGSIASETTTKGPTYGAIQTINEAKFALDGVDIRGDGLVSLLPGDKATFTGMSGIILNIPGPNSDGEPLVFNAEDIKLVDSSISETVFGWDYGNSMNHTTAFSTYPEISVAGGDFNFGEVRLGTETISTVTNPSIQITDGNVTMYGGLKDSEGVATQINITLTGGSLTVPEGQILANNVTNNGGTVYLNGTVDGDITGTSGKTIVGQNGTATGTISGDVSSSTSQGGDNTGFQGQLNFNLEISTPEYLSDKYVISEGYTMTIKAGGSLALEGKQLVVNGTLVIENGGAITGVGTNGEGIILTDKGAIQNNGVIGKGGFPVSVGAYKTTTSNTIDGGKVSLQNVTGISFALDKTVIPAKGEAPASVQYQLAFSGNAIRNGTGTNAIIADGAIINGDLTIGNGVKFDATAGVTVEDKAVVTVNGDVTGAITLTSGTSVVLNGTTSGSGVDIVAASGKYVTSDTADVLTGTTKVTVSNVRGVTVEVVSETAMDADLKKSMTEQRILISGTASSADGKTAGSITVAQGTVATTPMAADMTPYYGIYVDGELYIPNKTGTTAVDLIINSAIMTVNGEVSSTADIATNNAAKIVGTAYSVGTTDEVFYITGFDAAYAAIDTANSKTITVYGKLTLSAEYTIAQGQIVVLAQNNSNVVIDENGAVTIENGGYINGKIADVQGVLTVIYGGTTDVPAKFAVRTTNANNDVIYSGLAYALNNATEGETVNLVQIADVEGSLTIPAGVTLDVNEGATLNVDRNLTVNGTLLNHGAVSVDRNVTVAGTIDNTESQSFTVCNDNTAGVDDYDVTVAGTGVILFASEPDNMDAYNGAVYNDTEEAQYVYTTLSNAVTLTSEYDIVPDIEVIGTYSENATVNAVGKIVIADGATVSVTEIVLDDCVLTIVGTFTGAVTGQSGEDGSTVASTVQFSKATGVVVANADAPNDANVTVWTTTVSLTEGSESFGLNTDAQSNTTYETMTVTAGVITLAIEKIDAASTEGASSVIVNAGAEIVIPGGTDGVTVSSNGMTVDGTITVEGTLNAVANTVINGTMDIALDADVNVTAMTVTGTVNVATQEDQTPGDLVVTGVLTLGERPETLGAAATGAVVGPVKFGTNATASDRYIVAYAGADMSGAVFEQNQGVSTGFYINDALYMTVYAQGNSDVGIDMTDIAEIGEIDLVGYVVPTTGTPAVNDIDWYDADGEPIAATASVGSIDAVYTTFKVSNIPGVISVGNGLSMYIDGLTIANFVAPEGSEYKFQLPVGTHTVSIAAEYGYDATNAVITFNGQTVQNGGTITVTADMVQDGFTLAASGAVPSTSGGSTTVVGGDDGMGLTDYLLIILVILIVVMAIMVAMRLMRS